MKTITRFATTATVSLAAIGLSVGPVGAAPIDQEGLVNVGITGVNVQVPISAAANICGVGVAVLATAANLGDVDCTAEGVAVANSDGSQGGPVRQRGLVNVALTDTTVQVPVAIAANVCGVGIGVLSQVASFGDVDCRTEGVSLADVS